MSAAHAAILSGSSLLHGTMPGGPKKHHSVYMFGRKRRKSKKKVGESSSFPSEVSDRRGASADEQPHDSRGEANKASLDDASLNSAPITSADRQPPDCRGEAENASLDDASLDSAANTPADARLADQRTDGQPACRGEPNNASLEVASVDSAPDASEVSARVRIDSKTVTDSDVREASAREKAALERLASTAATTRKMQQFTELGGAAASVTDERKTAFTAVDMRAINSLLGFMRCQTCQGRAEMVTGDREYGLAVKLILICERCGEIATEWSSRRVQSEKKCNPFEINILAGRAMLATGNGQTAMNDIFAAMGLSGRGLHNKTFQRHLKKTLNPGATRAAEAVMVQCAEKAVTLYENLCFGHKGNIAVCFDGTWMTRGHSSHIGVGAVAELFTGYILDYVVLSNFCLGCEIGPRPDSNEYAGWRKSHQCQKNTDCKSGQMEVEAGLILFQRSLERNKVKYSTMLCDGDSRTFNAIKDAKVYGFVDVQKEDCINHVQKRMGAALRNLLQKHKSEGMRGLGGKGRLTADLINKLSAYYGRALKSHCGDVDAMQRAVMATYHHVTSTDSCSNHSLCPSGKDSWCRHNAATAKGEPQPRHKYNLPADVAKALLPVYERLADVKLLDRCKRGRTQNSNESFHSVIWSMISKEQHFSLFAVEAAVAEAVLRFNAGNEYAATAILQEMNMNVTDSGSKRAKEKDLRRTTASRKKRALSLGLQTMAKKKHHTGMHPDYSPGAFS